MTYIFYILLGIITGLISGTFGIGGGVIMVPAMVMLFGLTQHQAQGTALAVMALPVFFMAAFKYYQAGNVKLQMALFIAIGLIAGAYISANLIQTVPDTNLKKVFGALMLLIGLKMLIGK